MYKAVRLRSIKLYYKKWGISDKGAIASWEIYAGSNTTLPAFCCRYYELNWTLVVDISDFYLPF